MAKPIGRWSFMYWKDNISNEKNIRHRLYRGTLREACTKFVRWARALQYGIHLDYEVMDCNTTSFVDLYSIKHPITSIVGCEQRKDLEE